MEISTIGVVGLGTMGSGIAEVCARQGYRVVAVETTGEALEHGRDSISGSTQRAVKRGSGAEAGGADWQTIMYEGYGPNGVAVLVECLTDNRNRAASEVRVAMTRNGGNMADPGSVSYLFSRKGVVMVPAADGVDEDSILDAVLDAGAEEVNDLGDMFEVVSEAGDVVAVRTALQDAGVDYDSAEATFVASLQVPVDVEGARKVFRLVEALEDSDDVQNVYTNVDVSDEVLASLDA